MDYRITRQANQPQIGANRDVYTEGSTVTITHPQTGDTITGTVTWVSPTHVTAMVKPEGSTGPIAYVPLTDADRSALLAILTKQRAETRVA